MQACLRKRVENNKYLVQEKLSEGGYGVIYSAINRTSNELVALKVISLNKKRELESFRREVNALNSISHPNIVEFEDSFEFSFQGNKYGVMEMEKMDMDLMDLILNNISVPEKIARFVFSKICHAIAHIHTMGLSHLDIKADNILISLNEEGSIQDVKLCDFGFAMNWCDFKQKTCFGTRDYRPLESFTGEYTIDPEKVDIWSLGVVLFTLITGLYPFMMKEDGSQTIHSLGLSVLDDFGVDKSLKKLLAWIFSVDPSERPTISQILNHPWVTGVKEKLSFGMNIQDENIDDFVSKKSCKKSTKRKLQKKIAQMFKSKLKK